MQKPTCESFSLFGCVVKATKVHYFVCISMWKMYEPFQMCTAKITACKTISMFRREHLLGCLDAHYKYQISTRDGEGYKEGSVT